jgi:hypothetical protein
MMALGREGRFPRPLPFFFGRSWVKVRGLGGKEPALRGLLALSLQLEDLGSREATR